MRLVYVLHQYLPRHTSGTENYVHGLAGEMRRRGHDVRVYALDPQFASLPPFEQRQEVVDDVKVTRVRYALDVHPEPARAEYQHPLLALRFGQWLDTVQPDVVHVFHLRHLGGDLIDECTRRSIPVAVHLMDFWFLCPRFTLLRSDGQLCQGPPQVGAGCIACARPDLGAQLAATDLAGHARWFDDITWDSGFQRGRGLLGACDALLRRPRWLHRRLEQATAIVAPSRFVRDTFVQNGYPEHLFTVLPYGLPPLPRLPRRTGDGVLHAGFLGTLADHKGAHVAVEAVQSLGSGFELHLHGRTNEFPDYVARLQALAQQDPRIHFAGPCSRDELPAVLANLDVLLVPSLWHENTPFVVLEAFAAGVPVFASDVGGIAEILQDGVHGERFARGDAQDLARRLRRAKDEPARLASYRQQLHPGKTLAQNATEIETLYARIARKQTSHA